VEVDVDVRLAVPAGAAGATVGRKVTDALGPAGLFAPGRYRLGQPVHASDIVSAASVDGVDAVDVARLRRRGTAVTAEAPLERVEIAAHEVARLDIRPDANGDGSLRIHFEDGQ
jgi:hypothetical protein